MVSVCLSVCLSVCALVRPSVRTYVRQILWHFFQTCTDDQAGCVDDCKDHFYQSYGLLLQMLL
jgi:hypothetical protein